MARLARAVAVDCAHHIKPRGIDRQRVFHTDSHRRTYLALLVTAIEDARLRVLADCKPEILVEIACTEEAPFTFYVWGNGIGINAKFHTTIFNVIRRLQARDEYCGGSGAGLTIARQIVERHGGKSGLSRN